MIIGTVSLTEPAKLNRQFLATTGTGHNLIVDDASGGTGPKPIELVAVALAGCTAFDVINILRKKRQQVSSYEVRCEAEQASDPPQVFTRVRLTHIIRGHQVDPQAVRDAIRLSEEKYCSVGAMVKHTAEIHTTFELIPELELMEARV